MTSQTDERIFPFSVSRKSRFDFTERTTAYVLMIGDRYYYSHKNNRLSTAHYLGGAKLFGCYDTDAFKKIEKMCVARSKKFRIVSVRAMLTQD